MLVVSNVIEVTVHLTSSWSAITWSILVASQIQMKYDGSYMRNT